MTGALGNFFLGERMFAVALRVSREMEERAIDKEMNESLDSQDKAYLSKPGIRKNQSLTQIWTGNLGPRGPSRTKWQ